MCAHVSLKANLLSTMKLLETYFSELTGFLGHKKITNAFFIN